MLLVVIALIALVAIYCDWRFVRRSSFCGSKRLKHLFIGGAVATHALLPVVALLGVLLRDNTPMFVHFAMWAYWVWLLTVCPRVAFYVLDHFRLRWLGALMAVGVTGILVWGATYGRTSILVTYQEISSKKIPQAFDGFRLVQISDIHLGTVVNIPKELTAIVDSVNSLHPDVVVFTGDLAHIRHTELTLEAQEILSRIRARHGVYSITGNHDVGVYIRDTVSLPLEVSQRRLIELQEQMGWHVLQDTTVYLTQDEERISLSGISFDVTLREKRHDRDLPPARLDKVYESVPDSLYNITAVHLPQIWEQIVETPYGDLTLAGHVHAMQMKIKLFGQYFSPARLMYPRWSGRYEQGEHILYINDGTGCVVYPMRLGAWPEITLITLHSCE